MVFIVNLAAKEAHWCWHTVTATYGGRGYSCRPGQGGLSMSRAFLAVFAVLAPWLAPPRGAAASRRQCEALLPGSMQAGRRVGGGGAARTARTAAAGYPAEEIKINVIARERVRKLCLPSSPARRTPHPAPPRSQRRERVLQRVWGARGAQLLVLQVLEQKWLYPHNTFLQRRRKKERNRMVRGKKGSRD